MLHTFTGSKLQRAKTSLRTIGPAVTNGGITTFLAVIVLCGSQSHAFIVFWKIFFLTVIFSLFHGVVLLPVVLCYLGPGEKKEQEIIDERQGDIKGTIGNDTLIEREIKDEQRGEITEALANDTNV